MGEIDRINPILRPVFGPPAAHRIQPGSDQQHRHEAHEDKLELSNHEDRDEPESSEDGAPAAVDQGLDLSI